MFSPSQFVLYSYQIGVFRLHIWLIFMIRGIKIDLQLLESDSFLIYKLCIFFLLKSKSFGKSLLRRFIGFSLFDIMVYSSRWWWQKHSGLNGVYILVSHAYPSINIYRSSLTVQYSRKTRQNKTKVGLYVDKRESLGDGLYKWAIGKENTWWWIVGGPLDTDEWPIFFFIISKGSPHLWHCLHSTFLPTLQFPSHLI